jgi:hypothetical protein
MLLESIGKIDQELQDLVTSQEGQEFSYIIDKDLESKEYQ